MKNFTKPKFRSLFVFTALIAVIAFSMAACGGDAGIDPEAPLTFTGDSAFDIPDSIVGIAIKNIDVSISVSGGIKPYTYSAKGLPTGIGIDSSKGVISGTPTTVVSNGTAAITVTDSAQDSKSITIVYGAVTGSHKHNFENYVEDDGFSLGAGPTIILTETGSCPCGETDTRHNYIIPDGVYTDGVLGGTDTSIVLIQGTATNNITISNATQIYIADNAAIKVSGASALTVPANSTIIGGGSGISLTSSTNGINGSGSLTITGTMGTIQGGGTGAGIRTTGNLIISGTTGTIRGSNGIHTTSGGVTITGITGDITCSSGDTTNRCITTTGAVLISGTTGAITTTIGNYGITATSLNITAAASIGNNTAASISGRSAKVSINGTQYNDWDGIRPYVKP